RGLRLLQLSRARERLAAAEARFVGCLAVLVLIGDQLELGDRLGKLARGEQLLSPAEDVLRGVLVLHLASIDHDRPRRPAGGEQGGGEEGASHCSCCTWAAVGGLQWNGARGSLGFTFRR